MSKNSTIELKIALDENHIPEKLWWNAQDGGIYNEETKSFLLSVWDPKNKEALRIDLWTKDMPVDDMKMFFYQTLSAMAETYFRATDDEKMRDTMLDFCQYFAEKLELK